MSVAKRSAPAMHSHYSSRESRSEGQANRIAIVPTLRSRRHKTDKQIRLPADGCTQTRRHYLKLPLEFPIVFRTRHRTNHEIEFPRPLESPEEQPARRLMDLSAAPFVLAECCAEAAAVCAWASHRAVRTLHSPKTAGA